MFHSSSVCFQIRRVFLNELELSVERLLAVLEPLQRVLHEEYTLMEMKEEGSQEKEQEEEQEAGRTAQEKQLRSALQVLLLAIASLGRQQLQYSSAQGKQGGSDYLMGLKEAQVEVYQQRALRIAPHDGAPFGVMSKLAMDGVGGSRRSGDGGKEKDVFLSAYYLARGMGVEVTPWHAYTSISLNWY